MTTIAEANSLQEAFLIQSYLRGSGIEAFIPNEFSVQTYGGFLDAMEGVRVQVDEQDIPQAKDLLAEYRQTGEK